MKDSNNLFTLTLNHKENLPRVDILIPFHRVDIFLIDAISSAHKSNGVEIRVIAINDSGKLVKKTDIGLSSFDLLIESDQKGYLGALRTGFRYCSSEFVAFLDSDDLQHDDRIATQILHLRNTGADISSCEVIKFRGDSKAREVESFTGGVPEFNPPELRLLLGAHGADSSQVIRFQVLEKYWRVHSEFPAQLADYGLLLTMILQDAKFIFTSNAFYFYRSHQNQISRKAKLASEWKSIFPLWLRLLNSRLESDYEISSNLGLLISFPSSLTKISHSEVHLLRKLQHDLMNKVTVQSKRRSLRMLFGIREVIGRRAMSILSSFVIPYLLFQLAFSRFSWKTLRRNGG